MHITEIDILLVRPQNGLLAFSSFVINNAFRVSSVAIHSRMDGIGYRLVYPATILHNGKRINTFYPINLKAARAIEEPVIAAFLELQKRATHAET